MEYLKNITLKNGQSCVLRNAVGDDAQQVLDVFLNTHEQTDFLASYRDEADFDVGFERKFLVGKELSEKEVFICALVGNRVVGSASVDAFGGGKMSRRATFSIAIEKDFWGLGIGQAMTAASIECAKTAGYAQLELEVVSGNKSAFELYKKMGFVEYGRNPKGLLSRYCGWQELIYMRLELN